MSALAIIEQDIMALEPRFNEVSCDVNISFKREAEFAIQLMGSNEFLLKTAMNNRQSVVDAVTNISAIGISLNPAKRQAYLVPRKNKVCLDISYLGLVDLAVASGAIRWVQSEIVRAADEFELNGFGRAPMHVFNPFGERGDIVGAYVVAKTSDGDFLTGTMPLSKLMSIKNRSESGKTGKGPWATDFEEMCKKTVVKQSSKYWPRVERLDRAIHYLNNQAEEGIDFAAERAEQEADSQQTGRKPAVSMPQERQPAPAARGDTGVTDVPHRPAAQRPAQQAPDAADLATAGEVAWIGKKLKSYNWNMAYACEMAGIDARDSLDGLTKAEFSALKAVL